MQHFPGAIPPVRDLVLIGGGHANVQVLKRFGMRPEAGVRPTLISAGFGTPYSGMLPGCIAGTYTSSDIHINLSNLCRFAGARFVQAEVVGLDLEERRVTLAGRPSIAYDVLSLNVGAQPIAPNSGAIAVKPISEFLPKWEAVRARLERHPGNLTIVGAGAGGAELALAAAARLTASQVTLIGPELLPGQSASVQRRFSSMLARCDVTYIMDSVRAVGGDVLELSSGRTITAGEVLWVTGVEAPGWIRDSQLATDSLGFVRVGKTLASVSHTNVFAAGDIAHLEGQERPKSGVFAVRAGPILSQNVRAQLIGAPLKSYKAQRHHLALIGDGRGSALATRSGWSIEGAFWWRLKRWIDEKFINNFNDLPEMVKVKYELPEPLANDLPSDDMRCGGCGAKIAAEPLRRVLARLPIVQDPSVLMGIGDDAAQLVTASGTSLMTIDGFRAMMDDPYVFGRIATHHSLNDIFAMGASPRAVMSLVTVPLMSERLMEEDLYQLMRGVVDVLTDHGAALIGGHSAEGAELSLGLSVYADAPDVVLSKAGAREGDMLVLSKPLGTGLALASAMGGAAPAQLMSTIISSMDQSSAQAAATFINHRANALTDITGFGLVGHLSEMMRASGKNATIELGCVPAFDRVEELYVQHQSSLQTANEGAFRDYELKGSLSFSDPKVRLLADPQTSGGLLGAVPAERAQACVDELLETGHGASIIGKVSGTVSIIK
ncbi:MAG: selenide, water dikinase SelD [Pseudomonadales bacterium]|nr:selenide, water dikinase SelD [Pseudomonadales bacterium]